MREFGENKEIADQVSESTEKASKVEKPQPVQDTVILPAYDVTYNSDGTVSGYTKISPVIRIPSNSDSKPDTNKVFLFKKPKGAN